MELLIQIDYLQHSKKYIDYKSIDIKWMFGADFMPTTTIHDIKLEFIDEQDFHEMEKLVSQGIVNKLFMIATLASVIGKTIDGVSGKVVTLHIASIITT